MQMRSTGPWEAIRAGRGVATPLGYRAGCPDRSRRDSPKITGGTARFTTSRMAKLD